MKYSVKTTTLLAAMWFSLPATCGERVKTACVGVADGARGRLSAPVGPVSSTVGGGPVESRNDDIGYPAAEICETEIESCDMAIKSPRYVRYGWQTVARTDITAIDPFACETGADDCGMTPEKGIECGVSACFSGRVGHNLIVAGGCNFPEMPLAAASVKRFYRGIYVADTAVMQWRKIGELPEAIAYGGSATTARGIALIGGTTATEASGMALLLNIGEDGMAKTETLPSLPCTIDNAAACSIDDKIYVAGGNVDGMPSNALFVLDLSEESASWRRLRPMPGNPRVQPSMSFGTDADGEACLYLWGGFAGRSDKRQATLETAGLKYTPSKNKWSVLEAPATPDGTEISTGGGAATTLSDGKIAVCGGVDKDIFLEALRNQTSDYLNHPAEWYRFNDRVLVFDPEKEKWSIHESNRGTARAGAAIVAGADRDFYLIGGELKPRIRTAETIHVQL